MNHVLKNGLVSRAGRRPAGDASICENDVKFAEIFGQCCEEPLTIFCNGDIGSVAARVWSKLGDGFIQRLLVATGNSNLGAFRDEKPGSSQADATVPAGNKSGLPCQFHSASFL